MVAENLYNEHELLQRIAKGDQKAFEELYAFYSNKIFAIAFKILKSVSAAEDVMQEVFTKVWINNEKLKDVTHFRAYLYAMTRNQVFNVLRKQANEEILLAELGNNNVEKDHADALSFKQMREQLQSSLTRLPAQQRKVFELGKIHGLKHEEIARQLFISPATVKKHMMAAMRAVKNFFF